ncbi:MAG: TetR family transcriptional regulator [Chloroflexales bacterium]|nr:TetR family transcriptional regulator [Chloroflexales bacterium]
MPGAKVPERERREQILHAAVAVATQAGLASLTVRKIAEAAGTSVGLVFFHYQTMELLRDALLDWLLERVLRLDLGAIRQRWLSPRERVLGLLAEELTAAHSLRSEITLLLEYWVQSTQQPAVRHRLQHALADYTAVVHALAADALAAATVAAVTPAGFASAAVRGILGVGLEMVVVDAAPDATAQLAMLAALLPGETR